MPYTVTGFYAGQLPIPLLAKYIDRITLYLKDWLDASKIAN